MHPIKRDRRGERGVSFLLVVAGIFSILAMAALAIDVATLYAANSDAQKAADAAALAGAKMFVMSSSTSGGSVAPSDVCTNGAGQTTMANAAATAAAQANTVGGATAQITNVNCVGTTGTPTPNPRITVTVGRTDLPLFFARIFGAQTASVSATATAEAYNNSGASNTTKIQVGSVKPWLVENCQPGTGGGGCAKYYFFQAVTNALNNPTPSYLGQPLRLVPYGGGGLGGGVRYYISDPPTTGNPTDQPNICPSTTKANCGPADGSPDYYSDVACANQHQVVCGDQLTVSNNNVPGIPASTEGAVQCLIHADATGLGNGQDSFTAAGLPVTITNGTNNPNTTIPASSTISTSDSVVTVPVFNYTLPNPCNPGPCAAHNEMVVGFLQLGIQQVEGAGGTPGAIDTVVLNAVGCNTAGAGTAVSGGGISPIPVRLVQ
jgi:Putative Flp pilus-assembly TadE/G-like